MTAPDPRLGEIAERLENATPGPWEYDGHDVNQSYDLAVRTGEYTLERVGIIPGDYVRSNDAEFIAAAPADVAYLLAELRKAREALAEAWDEAHFGALGCDSTCCDYMHGAPEKDMNPYRAAVAAATGGGDQ